MLKNLGSVFVLVSLSFVSSVAMELYNQCAGCHGVDGGKSALGRSKIIKDMTKEEIESALLGYKNNTYGGPMKGLMKVQVKKLTDEEIMDLAVFISSK